MNTPEDALLCAYYGASLDGPERSVLTIADLERRYPKIRTEVLQRVRQDIERRGWIEWHADCGHRITEKGRERYLED